MSREEVICRLCGESFIRISPTHLKYNHNINSDEYQTKFPEAPMASESWCIEHSQTMASKDFSVEHREALAQGDIQRWTDPEQRQARSTMMTELWKTKEYQKNLLNSIVDSGTLKQSMDEAYLGYLLEINFPGIWLYNGDGRQRVFVGRKIPDFIRRDGKAQVIELFELYWKYFNKKETLTAYYSSIGYRCLVIWTHELDLVVISKVKEFLEQ